MVSRKTECSIVFPNTDETEMKFVYRFFKVREMHRAKLKERWVPAVFLVLHNLLKSAGRVKVPDRGNVLLLTLSILCGRRKEKVAAHLL